MKTLFIMTLAALLSGCRPDTSSKQNSGASTEVSAAAVTYSGGDGSTMDKAVIIKGVKDEEAGVAAEYAWLKQHHPGYSLAKQGLQHADAKNYDVMEIKTSQGEKSIYFDITRINPDEDKVNGGSVEF